MHVMTQNLGVCPDGVDAAAAGSESAGGAVDSPPPILCGQIDERVPLVEQIRAHNMILDLNCVGGGEFLQFPDDTFESTFRSHRGVKMAPDYAGTASSPHVDRAHLPGMDPQLWLILVFCGLSQGTPRATWCSTSGCTARSTRNLAATRDPKLSLSAVYRAKRSCKRTISLSLVGSSLRNLRLARRGQEPRACRGPMVRWGAWGRMMLTAMTG